MNRKKEKNRIYHSIVEIEKNFFPKSFEERMLKKPEGSQALGVSLAKESLDKIKQLLAE
ncbi:MAG: hypothetical protein ACYSTS_09790 [Planctomycetota bacterium]|jgi:hypothetical protein